MFENWKKLNAGRVRVKIIATLLALILTFTNFTLLGSYIGRASYATDSELSVQNDATNSNNVKFETYFDANNKSLKEKTANINSEDTMLYISVNVRNEGYLKNAKVELVNTNFAIKGNESVKEFSLNTIETDKGITVEIPIVAISNEKYNLGLLNMISQIKLIGEYIDNKGNVTDIETVKNVKVTWKTDEITEENISLSQEVITNKTYTINGETKRIVQVLVKSAVKDNIVPVKQTNIELSVPEVGVAPEEVNVASYTTKATNGKTSIEFNDLQTSSWNYNKEEGKVSVEIKNPADESNNVSWVKNSADEIIITYIYNEDVVVTPFNSVVKTTIEVYGTDANTTIEKTNEIDLEELPVIGDIANVENKVSPEIYKGNLYINKEENFTSTYNVYLSYKDLAKKVIMQDLGDEISEGEASTYYKETKINKAEAVSVLGQDGTIEIYNAEDNALLQTINLNEVSDEEYIVVEYDKEIATILIQTSPVQKEGKIEIINQKALKAVEEVTEINKLSSKIKLTVKDLDDKTVLDVNSVAEAKILEPSTKYSVSLDKTSLSTQAENTVQIRAELKTENSSSKLFTNPEIRIELPAEIVNASVENITPVLHSDELTLKSYEIVTNDAGDKELIVKTEGTQTKYGQNAYIVVDLKVKTNSFMASKNVNVKTTCVNGKDSVVDNKAISLVSKTGFVTKNTLTVGEDKIEKINTNKIEKNIAQNANFAISSSFINNFGETISNVNIVGNLEDEMTLVGNITTNIEKAEVYYSTEKITDANSESWTKDLQDLSKAKSFKIVLPSNLEQGSLVEVGYSAIANIADLSENKALTNSLNVNYVINKQAKQEKIEYVLNAIVEKAEGSPMLYSTISQGESVEVTMTPKAMTEELYQGQIVTYVITVKNTGTKELDNMQLEYTVPEGALITELTYSQGTEITYTDKEDIRSRTITIEKLRVGATVDYEITLRIKADAESIENKIIAKNEAGDTIGSLTTNAKEVNSGDLSVMLSRRANWTTTLTEGSTIMGIVILTNNTESAMNNLKITSKLPEGTSWVEDPYYEEYNDKWTYDSSSNTISYTLDTLEADKSNNVVSIPFVIKVNKINDTTYEDTFDNMVLVKTENGKEYASNVYSSYASKPGWKISMTSEHNDTLKEGDAVKYIINVQNVGGNFASFTLVDEIPEEIKINSILSYWKGKEDITTEYSSNNNSIDLQIPIADGETAIVEIEGTVKELADGTTSKEITNTAKIPNGYDENNNIKYKESNTITNTIIGNNDGGNSGNTETKTYSIAGSVWLDENKDGIKETNEKAMQSQRILLLDKDLKVLEETVSSLTGTYKFDNLSSGNYLVAIVYDKSKYGITKYQVKEAEESTNSDVTSKEITLEDKSAMVGITDTIKVENSNISNIDMGLIEAPTFDLSLSKNISKVSVTTKSGTSTYNYEEPTNLAKVEIGAKEISGATLVVEYEIEVTNNGEVNGYVTDIIDYMPSELTFNSEMNTEWYKTADNYLHYMALDPQAIKPGESEKVKLVLTKTLGNNTTGVIRNEAEIGVSSNLEGIVELDSTGGNKQEGEDDISVAELIVSIKTGSPMMYTGIVIISMLVIGIGIYIINKKVIKVNI